MKDKDSSTSTKGPTGRGVIVTGGGSGIGREIAKDFAEAGATVVIIDVSAGGERTAAEINAGGGAATALRCDITNAAEVAEAFATTDSMLPALDVLVNNAGVNIDQGIRRMSDESWRTTLDVNLSGAAYCTREASRRFVPQGRGAIVNIASRAWLGWFGQTAYAASKGGVISMTRSVAIELAQHNVRVNCVAPGLIDTPLLQAESPAVRARLLLSQPSRRIGAAEDVAWAVRFLSGDSASSITGQVLYVCGGKSVYASAV